MVVDNFRLQLLLLPMCPLRLRPLLLVAIKTLLKFLVSLPLLLSEIQELSVLALLFMSTSPTTSAVKPFPYRPIHLLMQGATSNNSHLLYSPCTERIIQSLSSVVSCPLETTLSLTNLM
jgi:hypothetical protein